MKIYQKSENIEVYYYRNTLNQEVLFDKNMVL